MKLRSSEWLLIAYFSYVAAIAPRFPLQPGLAQRPIWIAVLVCVAFCTMAYGESRDHVKLFSIMRDWASVALILLAYREMDWFRALPRNFALELRWERWDRELLYQGGLRHAVEALGALGPLYFEICYALVYAVAPFFVAMMYVNSHRSRVKGAVFWYLLGTLLAYAMFPYFPSDPPRVAFGGTDLPNFYTPARQLNLWLVGDYGIHSAVFPSAHVSSAFTAAWVLFAFMPGRKQYGWGMLVYAISVAIATVYGRYHYAADAAAGFMLSLIPGVMILLVRFLRLRGLLAPP